MNKQRIGVLVMSYGTPESMESVEAYYTDIRRGNPPTSEQLQELVARYEAISLDVFPLRQHTNEQVSALEEALNKDATGDVTYFCCQGLKHASPFVRDGVVEIDRMGADRAVGIVLAPHYSMMSIGSYVKQAQAKADEIGLAITFVESYHLAPKLIQALTDRVNTELAKFAENGIATHQIRVLFTAHSLPKSILEHGDPYPTQLMETAQRVADCTGVTNWSFAWQSAGRTSVPWLGPDLLDVLRELAADKVANVLVCPIGFVSDHLEVLYDIDIEAMKEAEVLGIKLRRTASLNADPLYIQALKEAIVKKLEES